MKKWFINRNIQTSTSEISSLQVDSYKELLIAEMKKLGASEQEVNLVCNNLILNSIRNGRQPEDVAWAILQ